MLWATYATFTCKNLNMSISSSSCVASALLIFVFLTITITSHCLVSGTTAAVPPAKKAASPHGQMSVDYYAKTCPQVEKLVGSITSEQFKVAPFIAPATMRLFFHDCFVEGCDASVLITTKSGSKVIAERDALDNKDFPAEVFESVDKAKALLETNCPGVVSCADILAISSRDYVHLAGGPYYEVKKGRWDGKRSKASQVYSNLPRANSTVDQLVKLFNSKGLTMDDMVVLSGAHTIGYSHCKYVRDRIYDYKGTKQPQPNVDPKLLSALRMYCPKSGGSEDMVVPFDVTTPYKFDHAYYTNLEANLGVLETDQALYLDQRTKPQVQALAKDMQKFFQAFAQAMEKMGAINVKRGWKHGEKRTQCNLHMKKHKPSLF